MNRKLTEDEAFDLHQLAHLQQSQVLVSTELLLTIEWTLDHPEMPRLEVARS